MKKVIFFVILISSVAANAQSLKDALFSGKLKNDSNSVVRKGDDLSTKIDTTTKKKPVEIEKPKAGTPAKESSTTGSVTRIDSTSTSTPGAEGKDVQASNDNNNVTAKDNSVAVVKDNSTVPKDNNKIWKEFVDSLSSTMKTEVLPNKKVKSDTYYVLIEYEIGVDGAVSVNNVSCSPENTFLQQQVKERVMLTAPQMIPLSTNGKARKVAKKYTLILTKA